MEAARKKRKMWGCMVGFSTLLILPCNVYTASSQVFYEYPPSSVSNSTLFDATVYHLNCTSSICFINDTKDNATSNDTILIPSEPLADVILMGALSIVLGLMILVTVIVAEEFCLNFELTASSYYGLAKRRHPNLVENIRMKNLNITSVLKGKICGVSGNSIKAKETRILINMLLMKKLNRSLRQWDAYMVQKAYDSTTTSAFTEFASPEKRPEQLKMTFMMQRIHLICMILALLISRKRNVFVIAAIVLERNLQNVANYLIVSLAMADLMVACLVMPLGAVYVISNNWIMGPELCDMWTSIDVLCCTASILHLVAIALDRYWAVTNVDYIHTRNSNRIGLMIVIVWVIALVVSLAPQIPQFKDPEYLHRIEVKRQCLVSQDVKYQIFATSSTFYVPLFVIFALYWKIFQAARNRLRRRREMKQHNFVHQVEKTNNNSRLSSTFLGKRRFLRMKKSSGKNPAAEALVNSLVMMEGQSTTTMEILEEHDEATSSNDQEEETTAFTISRPPTGDCRHQNQVVSNNVSPEKSSVAANNDSLTHSSHPTESSKTEVVHKDTSQTHLHHHQPATTVVVSKEKHAQSRRDKKESLEAKRERKAAKTLAIITGAFVMCWLPFFVLALVMPLCGDACSLSEFIMSFALWLGYFNSTLNPVIYTIFNPEFRQAFKRILCGGHRRHTRNFRSGKLR